MLRNIRLCKSHVVTIQLILVKKSNMVYTKGKVVGNEALPGVEYPVFVCPCLGSTTTRNSQRVATQTTVRGSAPRARLKNTGVSNEGNVHFTLYPVSQHERNQRGFRPERRKSMADLLVQRLLEQAVDSRTKLQIVLLFHENPRFEATSTILSNRLCRDIWSIRQALQELAEDGILAISRVVGGEEAYSFSPLPEYIVPLRQLVANYDDPVEREDLFRSIRELAGYALLRHAHDQRFYSITF